MKKFLKEMKPFLNIKCMIWALICTVLVIAYSPLLFFSGEREVVSITLLDERNPSALGREAWIEFDDDVNVISKDSGWSRSGDSYVGVTPNAFIVLEFPVGRSAISLGRNQYSGMISIKKGDAENVIDLYNARTDNYEFIIQNPVSFKPTFYKFAVLIAVFILSLFAVTAIKHFLHINAVPPIISTLLFFLIYPEVSENWLMFVYVLVCSLGLFYLWKTKFEYVEQYRKSKLLNTLTVILAFYAAFAFWGFELFLDSEFVTFKSRGVLMLFSLTVFTLYLIYAIISLYEKFKKKKEQKQPEAKNPMRVRLICFAIISVISTVWCLIFAPGNMTSDNVDQWLQAAGCYSIFDAHPAIHTILIRLTTFGYKSPVVFVILQSLFFAFVVSGFFGLLYKKGAPAKFLYTLSVVIAAAPNTAAMLSCPSKNILFAILICWLTVQLVEIFDDPKGFFGSPLKMIQFVISITLNYLIRHNTFVFLPIIIAVCIFFTVKLFRSVKLKPVICVALAMLLTQVITGPVYKAFDVQKGESSLPIWVLVHPYTMAVKYDLPLTEETVEYLEKILPLDEYANRYSPYNSDVFGWSTPIPDYSEVTTSEALRHYLKYLFERPDVVIKDRLDGVNLIWDVFSHPDVRHDRYALGIWGPGHLSEYAYQFPNVFHPDRQTGANEYTLDDGYAQILSDFITHFNENDILNAIFWRNGLYIILMLLCIVIALKEKKYRVVISTLPAIAILLTLVLAVGWQIYQYVYFFPLCAMVISLYLLFDSRESTYSKQNEAVNAEA